MSICSGVQPRRAEPGRSWWFWCQFSPWKKCISASQRTFFAVASPGPASSRMWQTLLTKHCACSANASRIGPSQKNAARPNGSPQKNDSSDQRHLDARPDPVRRRVDVLAVLARSAPSPPATASAGATTRSRRRAGWRCPPACRTSRGAAGGTPPTTAASPTRSSSRRTSSRCARPGAASPTCARSRGGSRRSCPGRPGSAAPPRPSSTRPARAAASASGPTTAPTWISTNQAKNSSSPRRRAPPGLLPGRMLGHVGRVHRRQASLPAALALLTRHRRAQAGVAQQRLVGRRRPGCRW